MEIACLDHGYVRYIRHDGTSKDVLEAARMSTGNPTGIDEAKDKATLDYLYRHKHMSPFEQIDLVVDTQMPIFVAREMVRHRVLHLNEFSARYSEMPDLQYLPSLERIVGQSVTNHQGSGEPLSNEEKRRQQKAFQAYFQAGREVYELALEAGTARELARIVVPVSQYTKVRWKANARAWMQFLELRLAPGAQYEIRMYAKAIATLFSEIWPDIWALFKEYTLNAVTFSASEMALIREALASQEGLLGGNLGKSHRREFHQKLGWQP